MIIDFNEFFLAMNSIWASNTCATSNVTTTSSTDATYIPVTYVDKICTNIIGAVVFVILLCIMMININD